MINSKCTADIFIGISHCLYGIREEYHGEGILFLKSPFIIVQKTKEKGKRDISMPNNEIKNPFKEKRDR